jgi:hypothetical protein
MPNEIIEEYKWLQDSGTRTTNATATRNYTTAQVIDYDGYNGNYALFWKKITVQDMQQWAYAESYADEKDYESYNQKLFIGRDFNNPGTFTATGVRNVEFMFTYSINGIKTDLSLGVCECQSRSPGITNPLLDHMVSGERIYGVSLQVNEEFITYTYEIDIPKITTPFSVGMYDGPQNVEDFNFDFYGNEIWEYDKRRAGIINIDDGVNSTTGYAEEFNVDIPKTVYSIGTTYK